MGRTLFVLGIARSGTNLIAGMLNGHPAIAVALDPLMPLFRAWRDAALRAAGLPAPPSLPFQDGYFRADGAAALDAVLAADPKLACDPATLPALAEAIAIRAGLEHPELRAAFGDLRGDTFGALLSDAHARLRAALAPGRDAEWVGIKEVWVPDFVPGLARAFPAAKFVFVERDPRGVLASLDGLARRDPTQNAHRVSYLRHWRKGIALARRYADDPALAGRTLVVRFEDAAADPARVASRLAEFLGVDALPGMLTPRLPDGRARAANTSFSAAGAIALEPIDAWRRQLDAAQIALCEALCAADMRFAGYAPDETPAIDDPRVVRAWTASDADPGSWRSDSGDRAADMRCESRRRALLDPRAAATAGSAEIRRHFLFSETHRALLGAA